MISQKIIASLMKFVRKFKPFVIKAVPIGLLRSIKECLANRSIAGMTKIPFLPFDRSAYPDGINLIGFIRGEIGLGQSCRLVANALNALEYKFTIYNYDQVSAMRQSDMSWENHITNTLPYNINIFHINPSEMPFVLIEMGRKAFNSKYNIAFWLWELEEFPAEWVKAIGLFNEIWTPSEFASTSIRKVTDKPVNTIPYSISAPTQAEYNRDYFNLPNDKFLYLCMYDCNSTIQRKNPMGAISAYKLAFPEEREDTGLVIKVNNAQKEDLNIIARALADYANIYLISDILPKTAVNSLIECADVFISLHRSEGFGLVPAEAMYLGTPCVATGWSSNTEFMNKEVACMVDYSIVTIDKDYGPYKAGNRWAEPNIKTAAEYLLELRNNDGYRSDIAIKAKKYIQEKLSLEASARLINKRIKEIYYNTKAVEFEQKVENSGD